MSKTRIFVSSTCYDLGAVREDLRNNIIQLGHEPLLSEYSSFPVNPVATAIDNCKTNVGTHTDIMVLIIGGRRGSLDPSNGKSITNMEYETARSLGVPCFVFVSRSVLNLVPVWKKNATADFTPAVDSPEVFSFIERIQSENRWMFAFDRTAEIKECLSTQISSMLRELLGRVRAGTLDPVANYANESTEAQRLAREKPRFWEFFLTAEMLKNKLIEVRRQYERLKTGAAFVSTRHIEVREFLDWIQVKCQDLGALAEALTKQLPIIQESWGPVGMPGDAQKLKQSVDDFIQLCFQLYEWERDLRSVAPPVELRGLRDTMRGWTETILEEIERLPDELLRPFKDSANPTGEFLINLTIKPPSMDGFYRELRIVVNRLGT